MFYYFNFMFKIFYFKFLFKIAYEQGPTKKEIACKGLVFRRSKRSFQILNMICGTYKQSIKVIDI